MSDLESAEDGFGTGTTETIRRVGLLMATFRFLPLDPVISLLRVDLERFDLRFAFPPAPTAFEPNKPPPPLPDPDPSPLPDPSASLPSPSASSPPSMPSLPFAFFPFFPASGEERLGALDIHEYFFELRPVARAA